MRDKPASGTKPGIQHAHNAAASLAPSGPASTPAQVASEPVAGTGEDPVRQRFIDAAAIAFHMPGVLPAKAFRCADELWAERELYLKRRAGL